MSSIRVPPEYRSKELEFETEAKDSGKTVLVTRPIVDEGLKLIRAQGHRLVFLNEMAKMTDDQFVAAVREYKADAVVSLLDVPVTAKAVEAIHNQVAVIAQYAVGFDNIDVAATKRFNLPVTTTPGVLTDATADQAFTLLLAATRNTVEADKYARAGLLKRFETTLLLGVSTTGKTLGVFGFGRIGQAMARRGRGFGMKIIYHDVVRLPKEVEDQYDATFVSFEDLCRQSDFISVHCNLTPQTKHMFDKAAFQKMKKTAIIVNSARGPVINEEDLVWALETNTIRAAGLDVYELEPKIHAGLIKLPNATLAPHLGSANLESRQAMSRMCGEAVVAALAGKEIPHRLWK